MGNLLNGNDIITHFTFRGNGAEVQTASTSQDLHFSVQSPAVETRDFQILSQLHIADTQVDLFSDFEENSKRSLDASINDSKVDSSLGSSFNQTVKTCKSKTEVDNLSADCSHEAWIYNGRNASLGSSDFELTGYKKNHSTGSSCNESIKSHSSSFIQKKLGNSYYDSKTYGTHFSEGASTSTIKDAAICCLGRGGDSCIKDEGLCEESPYLDRTSDVHILSDERADSVIQAGKDNCCQKKDNSCKKIGKLKQMKIMFGKLR